MIAPKVGDVIAWTGLRLVGREDDGHIIAVAPGGLYAEGFTLADALRNLANIVEAFDVREAVAGK